MKTAIVTGATGFIGRAVSISLLDDGYTVYGVGRSEIKFSVFDKYSNFHKIILDFEQYETIVNFIDVDEINFFFHTAYRGVNGAKKSDYLVQLQNLHISCTTVLQAAKLHCKRYIYIGSVDEYEIAKIPDLPFVQPTHSRIYATIKHSSEVIGKVLAYENNLEYVAALLALTYGEGNKTNVLPHMIIRNSIEDKPINLISGNNYFDMIHINEAIYGIKMVANHGKNNESYFIGHESLKTFKDIVEDISKIIGNKSVLNFGAYPDPSFSLDYSIIDRQKLRRDTGYSCNMDFENSVTKTYEWIKNSEYPDNDE